ncbi:MAG: hypothetical protein PHH40_03390 [Candidatus Moranbacteria bacterium]|nr:hypothetical protein [Candidatus Moranbacteria bacterium]MDD3964709.1 hypothetical protein [Candidatus Moranbacteria bacterium]
MRIRKEKIKFFEKHIKDFSEKAGREHLPWRNPRKVSPRGKAKITAYEVWVSEVMLQQTQVKRVIEYYTRFLVRFPDVTSLAKSSWEEFLPYYEGLGYYTRGRNMLRTAQEVVTKYDGIFPRDKKSLEGLPGIGPYTASAILSFAYGENHLAWDTNLHRVIGRFFLGGKHLVTDTSQWEAVFQMRKKILNGALMDFGSSLCVARPKCEACMLQSQCVYYREQGKQESINKKQKTENKKRQKENKKYDWKNARVYVFLHEKHRQYYSSQKKKYQPFILSSGYNTRAGIKQYFQDKYSLTLSVRPPHERKVLDKKPVLYVNAQILLGESAFAIFPKKAVEVYTRSILK